jgi:hypothetical protein
LKGVGESPSAWFGPHHQTRHQQTRRAAAVSRAKQPWRRSKWRRSNGNCLCSPTRALTPPRSPSSSPALSATAFSSGSSSGILPPTRAAFPLRSSSCFGVATSLLDCPKISELGFVTEGFPCLICVPESPRRQIAFHAAELAGG